MLSHRRRWWIADIPTIVHAQGGLRFYGRENAGARELGECPELARGLELDVERTSVPPSCLHQTVDSGRAVVDPSAQAESANEVPIPESSGRHGGGDTMILDDVFRGAGDESLRTGQAVRLDSYGIDLSTAEEAAQDQSRRSC